MVNGNGTLLINVMYPQRKHYLRARHHSLNREKSLFQTEKIARGERLIALVE